MSKRRTDSPEFKPRVAMEALSGRNSIQKIAADHTIHSIQVSCRSASSRTASGLFKRGKTTKDKVQGQAKKAELLQQIGRL